MKDRQIAVIQCRVKDQDFSDVYRIYLATEKGREKRRALLTVSAFFIFFLVMLILNHSLSFLFLMLGCVIVALSYFLVPINKKFIAENKLLFGEWRETVFYEHHVTVMELFQADDAEGMSEEELREATTVISASALAAYETENGFLFADGRISRQFVYIPKRDLNEEQLSLLIQFSSDRCSGGYKRLHLRPAVHDRKTEDAEEMVSGACERYYGADRLNLHDETGFRVNYTEEEEEPAVQSRSAGTHLDVDAELERILSETEAYKHGK